MSDALRSALLATRNVRIEEIKLEVGGVPVTFGIRQPTLAVQGKLLSALRRAAKAEDPEALNVVKVKFAMDCVVNESGVPVFNEKDRNDLLAQPSASWIDRVYDVAMRLMQSSNVNVCKSTVDDGNGGKKECGGELLLGAPRCPWCGADVPTPVEAAEGN